MFVIMCILPVLRLEVQSIHAYPIDTTLSEAALEITLDMVNSAGTAQQVDEANKVSRFVVLSS